MCGLRPQREDGIAMIMALGMLIVLTIVGSSALYYTTTSQRSATSSKASGLAYSLAEAGIAEGLSKLATAGDPISSGAIPPTTITLEGGTATYSGALAGTLWTITSTGRIANPSGVAVADVQRTLTRQVSVNSLNVGSIPTVWDRIYGDDTISPCAVTVENTTISSPVSARGNLCLQGTGKITGSSTSVAVGGNVTLESATSIGISSTPIARADVMGTCTYSGGTPHSPCQGPPANADQVYATTVTTSPGNLVKPTVDFAFWYANAKPGPSQGCTTQTGAPPAFDNGGGFNNSLASVDLTPLSSSYTCEVRDSAGNLTGELSWNSTTKVLRVSGTIFFDGPVSLANGGQLVNYQGRASLYTAGVVSMSGIFCAGGTGSTNCRAAGTMSSWDPATNMLVVVAGGALTIGNDVTLNNSSAFQGVLYAKNECKLNFDSYMSGPIVCTKTTLGRAGGGIPSFFSWPAMPAPAKGQLYDLTSTNGFQLVIGPQSG